MARRTGTTLIEVLVAIFVMAIGLLSLLTLFPLGALSMAQAIKDDRTAHAEADATAIARFRRIQQDYDPTNNFIALQNAFMNGNQLPGYTQAQPGNINWPPSPNGPSWPVYLDPIGVNMGSQIFATWPPQTANPAPPPTMPTSPIWRVSLTWLQQAAGGKPQDIPRWFSLLDDIDFGRQGLPNPPWLDDQPPPPPQLTLGAVQRSGRYTWAYLCRQAKYSPGNVSAAVEMNVIVYDGRSLQIGTQGQPAGEYGFVAFCPGDPRYPAQLTGGGVPPNILTVAWDPTAVPIPQDAPNIRSGRTWILDATVGPNGDVHGYFYRVVSATQPSAYAPALTQAIWPGSNPANTMDLELQTNVRAAFNNPLKQTQPGTGVIVVMENVAEVFEMGP